jgi:hypothetical protein
LNLQIPPANPGQGDYRQVNSQLQQFGMCECRFRKMLFMNRGGKTGPSSDGPARSSHRDMATLGIAAHDAAREDTAE